MYVMHTIMYSCGRLLYFSTAVVCDCDCVSNFSLWEVKSRAITSDITLPINQFAVCKKTYIYTQKYIYKIFN